MGPLWMLMGIVVGGVLAGIVLGIRIRELATKLKSAAAERDAARGQRDQSLARGSELAEQKLREVGR